jgi:hypothetical protein
LRHPGRKRIDFEAAQLTLQRFEALVGGHVPKRIVHAQCDREKECPAAACGIKHLRRLPVDARCFGKIEQSSGQGRWGVVHPEGAAGAGWYERGIRCADLVAGLFDGQFGGCPADRIRQFEHGFVER